MIDLQHELTAAVCLGLSDVLLNKSSGACMMSSSLLKHESNTGKTCRLVSNSRSMSSTDFHVILPL